MAGPRVKKGASMSSALEPRGIFAATIVFLLSYLTLSCINRQDCKNSHYNFRKNVTHRIHSTTRPWEHAGMVAFRVCNALPSPFLVVRVASGHNCWAPCVQDVPIPQFLTSVRLFLGYGNEKRSSNWPCTFTLDESDSCPSDPRGDLLRRLQHRQRQ